MSISVGFFFFFETEWHQDQTGQKPLSTQIECVRNRFDLKVVDWSNQRDLLVFIANDREHEEFLFKVGRNCLQYNKH